MSDPKNTGGPAFPMAMPTAAGTGVVYGMTLREYAAIQLKVPDSGTDWLDEMIRTSQRNELAAKAMQGWAADSGVTTALGAKWAYEMADAMQKASNA